MKGTLNKHEEGWLVRYGDMQFIPLHPDFIEMMDTCFTSKFKQVVEFEIVTEWENGEVGVNGLTYAKLIHHSGEPNEMIDHIGDANKMVEISEDQAIEMVKDMNKQPMRFYCVPKEISDKVLFEQAILAMEEMYGSGCDSEIDAYFRGAKWMQKQLKGGQDES